MLYNKKENIRYFQERILNWHALCKRQFPWRNEKCPFKILLAEILLQRTDSHKVLTAYHQLITKYQSPEDIYKNPDKLLSEFLLKLGLNYRIKRLKRISEILVEKFAGIVPKKFEDLLLLPGVGPYIASAISCFAYNKPKVLLDSNFLRLYKRFFGILTLSDRPYRDKLLKEYAYSVLPLDNARDYNYAILDFSATICTPFNPKCICCPLIEGCKYQKKTFNRKEFLGMDLYAGAGGLSLGGLKAGLKIIYAFELDPKPAKTYEYNLPSVPVAKLRLKSEKVRETCDTLGILPDKLDLIIAGPPCQGYSISNLRTRNDLNPDNRAYKVFLKYVKYLKPKAVVIENVCGMETYKKGEVLNEIIKSLNSQGYTSKTYKLNALDFNIPQKRNRLFIVGIKNRKLPETMDYPDKRKITVGMAFSDLPKISNGNKQDIQKYRLYGNSLNWYQKKMREQDQKVAWNCSSTTSTDLILKRFKIIPQGGNWKDLPKTLFNTYSKPENCHRWLYRRLSENEPSITISNFRKNMLIHPHQDRTLTVREAARLQGFHDTFIFWGNLHSQQQQVANAVPPSMAAAVVKMVLSSLKGK